jgi:hypothetical protein
VAGSNHHKGRRGQPLFGRRSNSFSASSCRRVLAQCREFAVLEHVVEIGELVPSRARARSSSSRSSCNVTHCNDFSMARP